jgi:S1-C subfamily serine protease
LAEVLEIDASAGVLVSGVAPGTAELQRGDVILAVNGAAVAGLPGFAEAMRGAEGSAAVLEVERTGTRLEVELPAP